MAARLQIGGRRVTESAHASIALIPDACTSCMICVRECPCWCIDLHSQAVEVHQEGARRPRVVNQLETFTIDFGLCMYCGICIEVCPFDALAWSDQVTRAGTSVNALQLGIAGLSAGTERPSGS